MVLVVLVVRENRFRRRFPEKTFYMRTADELRVIQAKRVENEKNRTRGGRPKL